MSSSIDFSALTRSVTKEELRQVMAATRKESSGVGRILVILIVPSIVGILQYIQTKSFIAVAGMVVFALIAMVMIAIATNYGHKKRTEERLRFTEFASANGLKYVEKIRDPIHPGMIFSLGRSRLAEDVLLSDDGFEIGEYQYTTGSGKSRQTHHWAYLCIRLDRKVPHMVLDAKSNNLDLFGLSLSNLPVVSKKDQTLQLEGDFNKYFTLYAPKEYEGDALYVFTPDLMAHRNTTRK